MGAENYSRVAENYSPRLPFSCYITAQARERSFDRDACQARGLPEGGGRDPFVRFCWEGSPVTRIPLNRMHQENQKLLDRLEMSTAEIGLSVRTTNCLEEKGIFTVQDLLNCTRDDLLSISNFGEKTLEEVYKSLETIGFMRRSRQPELAGV
jgi:DNA-directed RNA polymerase subunit alpha